MYFELLMMVFVVLVAVGGSGVGVMFWRLKAGRRGLTWALVVALMVLVGVSLLDLIRLVVVRP